MVPRAASSSRVRGVGPPAVWQTDRMERWRLAFLALGIAALACDGADVADAGPGRDGGMDAGTDAGVDAWVPYLENGTLSVLTYNVAGLPDGLSSGDPIPHMPQISPLLNAYDIALVQEDFWYHAELSADAEHAFRSAPWSERPSLPDIGDGLNRFSRSPFSDHERVGWGDCEGATDCSSDCLATKGWSWARHTLSEGIQIDVYNLHNEAGGCPRDFEIRDAAMRGLVTAIEERSAGRAVIVGGDFNLHLDDPLDRPSYEALSNGAGLTDACLELACGSNTIDRILYRSSDAVALEPTEWTQPPEFVDEADGGPLSDHDPTAVQFAWTRL